MKKGQIFTLDIFLAIAFMVMVIGFMMWQTEEIKSRGSAEYEKINMLANDWSQIAVKSDQVTALDSPNHIIDPSFNSIKLMMQETFAGTPYSYALVYRGQIIDEKAGCDTAQDIAVSRRLVYDPATLNAEELSIKICV